MRLLPGLPISPTLLQTLGQLAHLARQVLTTEAKPIYMLDIDNILNQTIFSLFRAATDVFYAYPFPFFGRKATSRKKSFSHHYCRSVLVKVVRCLDVNLTSEDWKGLYTDSHASWTNCEQDVLL